MIDDKRLDEIARLMAIRYLLDTKIPPLGSGVELRKWAKEGGERIGISPEEFAEVTAIMFKTGAEKFTLALENLKPQKTRKVIGFGK